MTKQTYLFYDLETTGLNVVFDQVIQFAAIRTDLAFNELERHEIRVQLRPDVMPSPYAVITHQIPPQTMQEGKLEVEAIREIHHLLNTPGTISLGYNTLGFDDEFLRFSFFRNLLPPYTHQYANQCYRMDILPIVVFYYLYNKNPGLHWPEQEGKVSLKLEALSELNELAQGRAHDAMVDVEATVALAKQLAQSPDMWQYCQGCFRKYEDDKRLNKLPAAFPDTELGHYREGLFLLNSLGALNAFQAPVLCLGQHHHYRNQMLFLRLDLPELQQTDINSVEQTTWVFRKKPGEPGFILPPLERFLAHLTKQRLTCAHENKAWLLANPEILQAIADYYLNYQYPIVPEADSDSILYQNGFLSKQDQNLCARFHQVNFQEKPKLIEQFECPEVQELAIRLLGRNYPQLLPDQYQTIYEDCLQNLYPNGTMLIDFRNRTKFNWQQAQQELKLLKLSPDLSAKQQSLLTDYEQFLEQRSQTWHTG